MSKDPDAVMFGPAGEGNVHVNPLILTARADLVAGRTPEPRR